MGTRWLRFNYIVIDPVNYYIVIEPQSSGTHDINVRHITMITALYIVIETQPSGTHDINIWHITVLYIVIEPQPSGTHDINVWHITVLYNEEKYTIKYNNEFYNLVGLQKSI